MSATPLLVFADDWGRHPSSCQHLIRRVREHHPVLWANTVGTRQVKADGFTFRRGLEKVRNWGKGLHRVDRQMWVVDLPMLPGAGPWARRLNRYLITARLQHALASLGLGTPLVLTTLPTTVWQVRGLPRRGLVYYCTDDYSHWPSADRDTLQQAERDLTREADLILGASRALCARHQGAARCEYFPHGVDYDLFAKAQGAGEVSPAVAALPSPRIGFFGLIYEKLDFDLLAAVAGHFPQASLVMIGPVDHCPEDFRALPNVHFTGRAPYADLPAYLRGLDVLLLPYVDDPMIRQSGPLKLRECLATGRPTVSVDVPEVRAYEPHVRVAADREAFLRHVGEALAEPAGSEARRARCRAVEPESWERRAEQLREYVSRVARGAWRVEREEGRFRSTLHAPRATPRKVLHLRTISGKGGGPEKTILNSPRFLEPDYQMRLAYIRPADDPEYDMPERARQMGVTLIDIPERGPLDPRTLGRLAREVRAFRPDVLHAHDYKTNVLSVILGRWFGIPVVTTAHGYVQRGGRLDLYYLADRWALRRMDHVIAVSEDLCRAVRGMGVSPSRCTLIENAIDTERFRRTRPAAEARRLLGFDPDRFLVGAVGRLSHEKGFDVLIRSVDALLARGHDLALVIAGEGDERLALQGLIDELGRGDRIRLLGYRSDTLDLFQAFDVFALSSRREGLPNVVLEALALEVPVVATRIAGVPRVIEDGANGLLISPDREGELSAALERLMREGELRDRLTRAGRETVEARYSFAARMNKVRALYEDVLRARPARRL